MIMFHCSKPFWWRQVIWPNGIVTNIDLLPNKRCSTTMAINVEHRLVFFAEREPLRPRPKVFSGRLAREECFGSHGQSFIETGS